MSLFKININDRNYSNWSLFDASTLLSATLPLSVDLEFNPIQHKLFTGDVFTFENQIVAISNSSVRTMHHIPGVLILSDNKTYGRTKCTKGRLFYKCIPDDIRLPFFLVPYEIKNVGFSKVFTNIYVTIQFSSWTGPQPIATISQNIGPVDILDNFYEYQLYCKSLNSSIQKFNRDTAPLIKEDHETFIRNIFHKYPSIEDRTTSLCQVFSIDPANSTDFDDAFSIKTLDNNTILLSIYIANVTILMDALNLWSSASKRISTIYLPDKKRPMLPTILSDCLCSLHEGSSRFALVLDLVIDISNNEILSMKYSNCIIQVHKNFVYEEPELLRYSNYSFLLDTTKKLSKKYKYISSVKNSHDVVSYLMILMNYFSAKELLKYNSGIFRSTFANIKQTILSDNVPEEVTKFITVWNSSCGHYVDISSNQDTILKHEFLEMDAYVHITSPIRRLVDLLNMIKLQQSIDLFSLSQSASEFFQIWIQQLDYINVTMRAIKKIQNDCNLLNTCYNDPTILEKSYDGYCFDKIVRDDELFQYIVYLPELKLTSRITVRENMDNYQLKQYKLILFSNEVKFKKKIRLYLHN